MHLSDRFQRSRDIGSLPAVSPAPRTDLSRFPVPLGVHGAARPVWDPTGTRLAVIPETGLAIIDVRAESVRALGDGRRAVRSMAWSPDGYGIAVAHEDRDVQQLLRANDGVELWRSAVGETAIDDVVWSPDGQRIAYVGDALVVCAAESGDVLWRRESRRNLPVPGVSMRRDGERVRVVEHVTAQEELIPCSDARWSSDGALIQGRWGEVRCVLAARDGEPTPEDQEIRDVLWAGAGGALSRGGADRISGERLRTADRQVGSVALSPDGRFAAAEGSEHRLWVEDANGVRALRGHPRTITALAWSRTGVLATACRDGGVRRLRRVAGEVEEWVRLDDVQPDGLAWSPDGSFLAVCCAGEVVILRHAPTS